MPDDTAPDVTYTPDSSSLASVLSAPPDNSVSLAPASAPTPTPVAPAPTKGPDLFRTLLAGALLGGATGAGGRNAGEGAALGSQAVIQNDQRQLQNQRALSADQRAEQLQGAQITHINLLNRQAQLSMDHDNTDFADKQSAIGQGIVDRRAQTITGQGLTADQLHEQAMKNPEIITKNLFAQTGRNGAGNPLYTTFVPKADNVPLTDTDIARFKSIPGFPKNIAPGQSVAPNVFDTWNAQANQAAVVQLATQTAQENLKGKQLENKKDEGIIANQPQALADAHNKNLADIRQSNASANASNASASKTRAEAQSGSLDTSSIVDGMIDGTLDITKIANIRSGDRAKYIALAKQKDPSFNQANYAVRLKTQENFAPGGKGNDQVVSLNTFAGHAGDANDLIQSLRNTNIAYINKPLNKVAEALGNDKIGPMRAALEAAKDEYLNFLKNGHAPQESEIKLGDKLVNPDLSPAQLQSTLRQMAKTVIIRGLAVNDGYKRVMGRNLDGILSPEAQSVLTTFGLGDQLGKLAPQSPQTQILTATNPQTGQKITSADGGQTWK